MPAGDDDGIRPQATVKFLRTAMERELARPVIAGAPGSRLSAIDILRAVAVLSVVAAHVSTPDLAPSVVKAGLVPFIRGGWIGVDLFFVLSGFLVSSLLFSEYERYGEIRSGRFLMRRGLKIYPAFYAMLVLTILYGVRGWWDVPPRNLLHEALFVQNYLPRVWGHTWTLAVEEHFYLLLTGGLFLLAVRGRRGSLSGKIAFKPLVPAFFAIACFCLIARVLTQWSAARAGRIGNFSATHLRIDELFFGVLLSYWWSFKGEALREKIDRYRKPLAFGVACVIPAFFFITWQQGIMKTVGFLLLYLTFGALLLLFISREIKPSVVTTLLRRVGVASYSIYLWHVPWREAIPHILRWVHVPESAWAVPILVYVAGSIVVGIAAAALIEFPVLRIRDRVLPSRSGSSAPLRTPAARAFTLSHSAVRR